MNYTKWTLYKAAHQNRVCVTLWSIQDIDFLMRSDYRLKMEGQDVYAVKDLH